MGGVLGKLCVMIIVPIPEINGHKSMSLDKTEIEKISWLARLALKNDDIPNYATDLSNILDLVDQMNAINTTDIEPLAHPIEIKARLRIDEVTETDQREKFQEISPATENGLYVVPKVIE